MHQPNGVHRAIRGMHARESQPMIAGQLPRNTGDREHRRGVLRHDPTRRHAQTKRPCISIVAEDRSPSCLYPLRLPRLRFRVDSLELAGVWRLFWPASSSQQALRRPREHKR